MKCLWTRGRRWPLLVAVGLLALRLPAARGDDNREDKPRRILRHQWKGEPYYGRGGPPQTFEQTGHADEISKLAAPSETPAYVGYYVGGGCAFKGGPPGPDDGTYGWDYGCIWKYKIRVMLGWCHKYQGGKGPYKIDGPRTVDIGPYVEKLKEGPKHHHAEGGEEHH